MKTVKEKKCIGQLRRLFYSGYFNREKVHFCRKMS